ncbi:MAG: MBL fold metallo-hydrolase [bacterium]|nr:MBL fold metallo-hydrolase [bacterium]
MRAGLQVILLGTGTPNAEPDRSGPAVAVVAGDKTYLVDFGPGVVRRAVAAGLDVTGLNTALLTHLHSDHTAGYPDLVLTPWTLGREAPLRVYGPRGLAAMTDHLLAAYAEDVRERLEGPEPANRTGHRALAREIEPGVILRDDGVEIEAFGVDHGSWPAFGYKFTTRDRTVVVSGDTAPCAALLEKARGCDLLLHEAYSAAGLERRPPEWQSYHRKMHTSAVELGKIASETRPRLLVPYHQLRWGATEEELLGEIRAGYDGEVVSGRDLEIF